MRAFIHAFKGKAWNEECQNAYSGFQKLGIECVLFSSNEELEQRQPEDVVVGGMLIMSHVLNERNIHPENYNYPDELLPFCGRTIRTIRYSELARQQFPVFIKPLEEKRAQGIVLNNMNDLPEEYLYLPPEQELICSEVVPFISEWRCFIRYGKIIGIRLYKGDQNAPYNRDVIESAVTACRTLPAGCSLDFGVTQNGRTLLIEMNDGFSIGCYGLPDTEYAKFLTARWAELNHTADPFAAEHNEL